MLALLILLSIWWLLVVVGVQGVLQVRQLVMEVVVLEVFYQPLDLR
jgi:hypothetical protein